MTDREYSIAIQDELISEGFDNFKFTSRNRFFAKKADIWYEFRVKYCRIPRRLKMPDVGYMTGLMDPNTIGVLITNGIEVTRFVESYLKNNGVDVVILNWVPDMNISDKLPVS